MKIKNIALFAIALVTSATTALADDNTPEQVKAAKEFKVEGIDLTATLESIRAKWPSLVYVEKESNKKIGLAYYRVDKTTNTDGLDFAFLDGKLMSIFVWYFPARIDKMGGASILAEKIVARIGKADNAKKEDDKSFSATWRFVEAGRYFIFEGNKERSILTIMDIAVSEKMTEKQKATAETGF